MTGTCQVLLARNNNTHVHSRGLACKQQWLTLQHQRVSTRLCRT
jgi:hypothetical protein